MFRIPQRYLLFAFTAWLLLPSSGEAWALRGVVQDAQGKPVAGAIVAENWMFRDGGVRSGGIHVKSDAQGRFDFTEWQEGGKLALIAFNADHSLGGYGIGQVGSDEPVVIRLEPTKLARAIVRWNAVNPVAKVFHFRVISPEGFTIAQGFGGEGEFGFPYVGDDMELRVRASEARAIHLMLPANGGDLGSIDFQPAPAVAHRGLFVPEWTFSVVLGATEAEGKIRSHRGNWVGLYFWDSRDPMSAYDVASLSRHWRRSRPDNMVLLAMHGPSVKSEAELKAALARCQKQYWQGKPLEFPVLLDSTGESTRQFGVGPDAGDLILIDPKGKMYGAIRPDDFVKVRHGEIKPRKPRASREGKAEVETTDTEWAELPKDVIWRIDRTRDDCAALWKPASYFRDRTFNPQQLYIAPAARAKISTVIESTFAKVKPEFVRPKSYTVALAKVRDEFVALRVLTRNEADELNEADRVSWRKLAEKQALDSGWDFFASKQLPSGLWPTPSGRESVARTALVLQAAVAQGATHRDGGLGSHSRDSEFGSQPLLEKALKALLKLQHPNGQFGDRAYDHGVVLGALTEVLVLSRDRKLLSDPVQRAALWSIESQAKDGGWPAGNHGRSDPWSSAWNLHALEWSRFCAQFRLIRVQELDEPAWREPAREFFLGLPRVDDRSDEFGAKFLKRGPFQGSYQWLSPAVLITVVGHQPNRSDLETLRNVTWKERQRFRSVIRSRRRRSVENFPGIGDWARSRAAVHDKTSLDEWLRPAVDELLEVRGVDGSWSHAGDKVVGTALAWLILAEWETAEEYRR